MSYLAIETTTRIDCTVTGKFMQKTPFIRAAALMGVALDVAQAAGAVTTDVTNLVAGQFYAVGAYGITDPVVKYKKGTALTAMPPGNFRLVDAALGIIRILAIPNDASPDAETGLLAGQVGGTVTAENAAGKDLRIDIGTTPQVALEVMVRNVLDVGPKGYLHLYQWNAAPDGEMGFITGNEDFEGVTVKGRAASTSNGIGYWRSLKA
ncbi:hypothetical protein [Methylobacterium sp. WL19]|uniref:hypothetical protein n=1 Tax=Methylobacterium sp. WL19 TaxID=2603896 RepID=UPI0011C9DFCB|nr:hypothetical protein [Methylobacterium sp. WL19]TXN30818.1 hypothetical protein FV220_05970 [Methylobacterium sp. WL19]